jgi:hypothetical protein
MLKLFKNKKIILNKKINFNQSSFKLQLQTQTRGKMMMRGHPLTHRGRIKKGNSP